MPRNLLWLLALLSAARIAGAQTIRVAEPVPGADESYLQAIHPQPENGKLQRVGFSRASGQEIPTRWIAGGTTGQPLPLPAGADSGAANAINMFGVIAGYVQPADGSTATATVWKGEPGSEVVTPLLLPPNAVLSSAYSINAAGAVAGFSEYADGKYSATVWSESGGTFSAILLPGVPLSTAATAISDNGNVAGYQQPTVGPIKSIVWEKNGAAYTAKTVLAADTVLVTAMNEYGVGAGVYAGDQPMVMVEFEGDYYAAELTSPFGSTGASNAVSDDDFIVGNVKDPETPTSGPEAALWVPTETFWDYVNLDQWLDQVNPSAGALWTLTDVTSISDGSFTVVGNGLFDPDGSGLQPAVERGFMLGISPLVPEPSGLASCAIAAALLSRRRRSR